MHHKKYILDTNPTTHYLSVAIVLKRYNSKFETYVRTFIRTLNAYMQKHTRLKYQIIVALCSSDEHTIRLTKRFILRYPSVQMIQCPQSISYAHAVLEAWQLSKGKYLFTAQVGDTGALALLPIMTNGLVVNREMDIIIGNRFLKSSTAGQLHPTHRIKRKFSLRIQRIAAFVCYPELFIKLPDPLSSCFMVPRSTFAGKEITLHTSLLLAEILRQLQPQNIGEVHYQPHMMHSFSLPSYIDGVVQCAQLVYLHLLHLREIAHHLISRVVHSAQHQK